ncbi:acyltransferase family protein [Cognatishimia activa]|uniref:Acyltransferase family protein n=1 Tax=Cognatishimia activa TaxID=1715691 RepID=A0A0P1IUY8_9RHOB|nr:acyltransferase [Cognatishimia activa]CUJ14184.1 Acyltransferase family protein [Cognatishimia activa]CUK24987.1 Acyltransferase family protein [Cognatishimia activa]
MARERMVWLDGLRLIAGLSMVGLHCTADSSGLPWVAYEPEERIGPLFLRAVFYTARTELFLLISVFLLLLSMERRPRFFGETMREQARRLLIPFVFWTFFYAVFNVIKAETFGYGSAYSLALFESKTWLGFFLLGDVKYHMHFLPTSFALLVFYPLFGIAKQRPWLGLLILVCLFLRKEIDTFIYRNFWGHESLPYLIRAVKVATYTGYGFTAAALLGIWERRRTADLSKYRAPMMIAGLCLFAFKLRATGTAISTGVWPYADLLGYWADFLMPVILFVTLMAFSEKHFPAVLSRGARYSFGIYLSHPIFVDFAEILLKDADLNPLMQVFVKIGLAVPLSVILVILVARWPAAAWTIGLGRVPSFPAFSSLQKEVR